MYGDLILMFKKVCFLYKSIILCNIKTPKERLVIRNFCFDYKLLYSIKTANKHIFWFKKYKKGFESGSSLHGNFKILSTATKSGVRY